MLLINAVRLTLSYYELRINDSLAASTQLVSVAKTISCVRHIQLNHMGGILGLLSSVIIPSGLCFHQLLCASFCLDQRAGWRRICRCSHKTMLLDTFKRSSIRLNVLSHSPQCWLEWRSTFIDCNGLKSMFVVLLMMFQPA